MYMYQIGSALFRQTKKNVKKNKNYRRILSWCVTKKQTHTKKKNNFHIFLPYLYKAHGILCGGVKRI